MQTRMAEMEEQIKENGLQPKAGAGNTRMVCSTNTLKAEYLNDVRPEDLNTIRPQILKPWPEAAYVCTSVVKKDKIGRIPDHVTVLSDRTFANGKIGPPTKEGKMEKEIVDMFPLERETPIACTGGYSTTLEEITNIKIRAANKYTRRTRTITLMLGGSETNNITQLEYKNTIGNILVHLRKGSKAEFIKGKVEEAVGSNATRTTDGLNRKTLFIRRIDGVTKVEDIRESLLKTVTPVHPEQIKIVISKNAWGGQSAVVTLVTGDAQKTGAWNTQNRLLGLPH